MIKWLEAYILESDKDLNSSFVILQAICPLASYLTLLIPVFLTEIE